SSPHPRSTQGDATGSTVPALFSAFIFFFFFLMIRPPPRSPLFPSPPLFRSTAPATTNMKKSNEPRTLTEAQINANRENAKKFTGPRSAEGKAASSRNRLLHGLRANKHILLDEDPAEFLLLIHDHFDRFQPVGPGEEKLVLRIAADQWRLDRALPAEAGIYRDRFHDVAKKDEVRRHQYDNKKR